MDNIERDPFDDTPDRPRHVSADELVRWLNEIDGEIAEDAGYSGAPYPYGTTAVLNALFASYKLDPVAALLLPPTLRPRDFVNLLNEWINDQIASGMQGRNNINYPYDICRQIQSMAIERFGRATAD